MYSAVVFYDTKFNLVMKKVSVFSIKIAFNADNMKIYISALDHVRKLILGSYDL